MSIELIRLPRDFGVELRGFSPQTLDAEKTALFRRAFLDHHLVLLRNVELDAEAHTALTETLGAVSFSSPVMKQGGERKYSFVSNQHKDGKIGDGELFFHADHTFFDWPLKAISLYALSVPSHGGETLFANAGAAYQRLPASLKTRVANLKARHMASYSAVYEGAKRPVYDPDARMKTKEQPVVWKHPETGAPILFVSRLITESIMGLSHEDSEELLEELFSYIEDPNYLYEHKWRVGDYLIWDNRQLQHARRDFDPSEPRAMRRVPIAETAPVTEGAGAR